MSRVVYQQKCGLTACICRAAYSSILLIFTAKDGIDDDNDCQFSEIVTGECLYQCHHTAKRKWWGTQHYFLAMTTWKLVIKIVHFASFVCGKSDQILAIQWPQSGLPYEIGAGYPIPISMLWHIYAPKLSWSLILVRHLTHKHNHTLYLEHSPDKTPKSYTYCIFQVFRVSYLQYL